MTNSAAAATIATVGIDVGGTFTDFVAVLPDGTLMQHKEPSNPTDPSEAVERGLRHLLAHHPILAGRALRIVHGTTLALNALLQHKVAAVALVVSRGHRDVLEIGRAKMRTPYDLHISKEQPVVPRDLVFEVDARMTSEGEVVQRPEAAEVAALIERLRTSGVGAVAIMLLNSYIDGCLEAELATAIRTALPAMLVTCSAEVWPEIREFERAVIAGINAEIHPLVARYLDRLGARIATDASTVLQITSSSGGMLSLAGATERPIETILSGPASGATAGARICRQERIPAALTFDMGGTSADIAVITAGEVEFTTNARVGALPLMMPVVGVNSIGAGGGSIVSVDAYGVIKVGPQSAGARPGPVAYGLGGTQPTVTDCYLVLGIIDPAGFLGGAMRLAAAAAETALAKIGSRLGLPSAAHAAEAALRVATVRMATELFKLLAQKGYEPSRHVLIPFGGAGPTHAVLLAEEAKLAAVVVPAAAATFCALGAAVADLRRDFVRSVGRLAVVGSGERLWRNWEILEGQATAWLASEGVQTLGTRLIHAVDMRYAGQSYSLSVSIPGTVREAADLGGVLGAFHDAHEAIYSFRESDEAVEAVTQRLSLIGEMPKARQPLLPPGPAAPPSRGERAVFHSGGWLRAAVFRREDFLAGSATVGPAVIEQDDTTLWLPPGWRLAADAHGLLHLERT